jgi:CheY-like chemotaxis protein
LIGTRHERRVGALRERRLLRSGGEVGASQVIVHEAGFPLQITRKKARGAADSLLASRLETSPCRDRISFVITVERRVAARDRRRVPRGGRRPYDQPGKHPPVLVADTDEAVRRAFVRYLDMFGFQVTQASRIDESLEENVSGQEPDVIVTELTTAAAARLSSSPRVPTIVTVTDDLHTAPRYAAAMLVKPFPLPTLLDELRRVLREQLAPE